jgi:hypothetical protein
MNVDGHSMGTSSVTRGLARHRRGQESSAKQASDKAAHPKMPEPGGDGAGSTHDHAGQEGGHEEIQKVVAEHGPAQTVEVKHDGEHHTVRTTHEDGHQHESKGHPSVSHVHEHIGHSIGAGGDEGQPPTEGESENSGAGGLEAMMGGGE